VASAIHMNRCASTAGRGPQATRPSVYTCAGVFDDALVLGGRALHECRELILLQKHGLDAPEEWGFDDGRRLEDPGDVVARFRHRRWGSSLERLAEVTARRMAGPSK